MNPSSGYIVRVQHLPDRTYRLWLQRPSGPVDLGLSMRTSHLYPDTHARTAAYFGVAPGDLGAVELITPTPPYYRKHQAVLTTEDDGRRLPAYVVDYAQGGFHLDTPEGIGIYPPEKIDFNPPSAAMTYRGRHEE